MAPRTLLAPERSRRTSKIAFLRLSLYANFGAAQNVGHFFAAIAKQLQQALGGVTMSQRVVYVPFSSMRSILNSVQRPPPSLDRGSEATPDGSLRDSVPPTRFAAMPEQDLSVWSAGLLLESLVSASRNLLLPAELRLAQIRKRDRA